MRVFLKMKIVKKNIEVKIYPTKADFNDNGEKIVSINKIESNIGINRFIYNKELEFINYFKDLLIQNGYDDKVKVNNSSCNVILIMLRQEYSFLEKAESSSRQQAQRDLINAFNRYYDKDLKDVILLEFEDYEKLRLSKKIPASFLNRFDRKSFNNIFTNLTIKNNSSFLK